MKTLTIGLTAFFTTILFAQTYPPQAGISGTTAIIKSSPLYVAWAIGNTVNRGLINKADPTFAIAGNNYASFGEPNNAVGFPDGNVVSLGDGGNAILTFATPIANGNGPDFAVFENASFDYLELAFVEVSSDGIHYFRFPAHSQTQTITQIGTFDSPNPTYLNNLAGKYYGDYGTPFDISELPNDPLLNKNQIFFVKVTDVVGSTNTLLGSFDSFGNLINDSFPTPFASAGFDLQAVGVINQQVLGSNKIDETKISLYPNPIEDFLYLQTDQVVNVVIFDNYGRKVFEKNNAEALKIDLSGLIKGVYFIKFNSNENQFLIKKLIKK